MPESTVEGAGSPSHGPAGPVMCAGASWGGGTALLVVALSLTGPGQCPTVEGHGLAQEHTYLRHVCVAAQCVSLVALGSFPISPWVCVCNYVVGTRFPHNRYKFNLLPCGDIIFQRYDLKRNAQNQSKTKNSKSVIFCLVTFG